MTRNPYANPHIPCPVPLCNFDHISGNNKRSEEHFNKKHDWNSCKKYVTKRWIENMRLHACHHCTDTCRLYQKKGNLHRHIKQHHYEGRISKNSDILMKIISESKNTTIKSNWKESLKFLNDLEFQPPPCRSTMFKQIPLRMRKLTEQISANAWECVVQSSRPVIDKQPQDEETSSSPLWKLASMTEYLLFTRPTKIENKDHEKCISKRIELYLNGTIEGLYQLIHSKIMQPTERRELPSDDVRTRNATEFANADCVSKASSCLTSNLLVAMNTEEHVEKLRQLHPPRINKHEERIRQDDEEYTRLISLAPKEIYELLFCESAIIVTLEGINKASAGGPLADAPLFFQRTFLANDEKGNYLNVKILVELVKLVMHFRVPDDATDFTGRSNYLCAFIKSKTKLDLRPIQITGSLIRFVCAHAARISKLYFSQLLLPLQFGIGIPGGIDFTIHSTTALCDKFLDRNPEQIRDGNLPTRALLLIDLQNFFNSVSRDELRDLLEKYDLHYLLPIYDLLFYLAPNKCWYIKPDGTWDFILANEGLSQGNALACFLACIVLHRVTSALNRALAKRAKTRLQNGDEGDDGYGSVCQTFSIIDDTQTVATYEDIPFILDYFDWIGPRFGLFMKAKKCKIVTSFNGESPLNKIHMSDEIREELKRAIECYCSEEGEKTSGVKLLGVPFGNKKFAREFVENVINKTKKDVEIYNKLMPDPQIRLSLFDLVIQARTRHTLFSEILHNVRFTERSINICSPAIDKLNNLTLDFFQKLVGHTEDEKIPEHAWLLMTRAKRHGGLGITNFNEAAIKMFFKPLTKSIRIAKNGIKFNTRDNDDEDAPSPHVSLNPFIERIYSDFEEDPARIFKTYRKITTIYTQGEDLMIIPPQTKLEHITENADLDELCGNITQKNNLYKLNHAFKKLRDEDKIALPNILNEETSLAISSISRQEKYMRLTPSAFRISVRSKLRLPILNPKEKPPICKCGSEIDAHLDHCNSCQTFTLKTRTAMHNRKRDTLFCIIRTLLPLTCDISKSDIEHEPYGIIPEAREIRPADVCINHKAHRKTPFLKTLIDVTQASITKKDIRVCNTYREQEKATMKKLEAVENAKYKTERYNRNGVTLEANAIQKRIYEMGYNKLPFVFTADGMLGPFFKDFLYGNKKKKKLFTIQDRQNTNLLPHQNQALMRSYQEGRITGLLPKADKQWRKESEGKWFTNSWRAMYPSHWAKQFVGYNSLMAKVDQIEKCCYIIEQPNNLDPKLSCDQFSSPVEKLHTRISKTWKENAFTRSLNGTHYMARYTQSEKSRIA